MINISCAGCGAVPRDPVGLGRGIERVHQDLFEHLCAEHEQIALESLFRRRAQLLLEPGAQA